jgi:hypothetical protein
MMIGKIDRRSISLVELYRRAKLAEQARRGESAPPAEAERSSGQEEIVSRRDERGTPYPGDFPNHLGNLYKGCF